MAKQREFLEAMKNLHMISKVSDAEFPWDNCHSSDRMLVFLKVLEFDKRQILLVICECCRLALEAVLKDAKPPQETLSVAEKWANGKKVSEHQMKQAYECARDFASIAINDYLRYRHFLDKSGQTYSYEMMHAARAVMHAMSAAYAYHCNINKSPDLVDVVAAIDDAQRALPELIPCDIIRKYFPWSVVEKKLNKI